MTADQETLFHERGVGRSALIWGPVFAAVGCLAELAAGGPRHVFAWVVVAIGLFVITLPWFYARRRFLSVRLTPVSLWQGREELAVAKIKDVTDVGLPVGARVLGGGWTVPKKYDELPIRLDDNTIVIAWARDIEALQAALGRVVKPVTEDS